MYRVNCKTYEAHFIAEAIFLLWKNRCTNDKQNKEYGHRTVLIQLRSKLRLTSIFDAKHLTSTRYNERWGYLNLIREAL